MRIFGAALLCILLAFALIGVGWMIKLQILIFVIIMATIICFIVGCFYSNPEKLIGMSYETFKSNWSNSYSDSTTFITVFSIFFPAMTGIMAGANISGDLKTPSKSIPLGTITSVLVAGFIYLALSTFLGASVLRSGCSVDSETGLCFKFIMRDVSKPPVMIYIGIYCASLSSALTSLVGAPRILMSVAKDNIMPILNIFGKSRKNGEPTYAYIPVFIISICCVAIADIDRIAEIVTITYLVTYSILNFACFLSDASHSPGWRPQFKMFNKWLAFITSLVCFGLVFVTNYILAIPISFLTALLVIYLLIKKPKVDWGSAKDGFASKSVVVQLLAQRNEKEHIKNFIPKILILTNDPVKDKKMITFVQTLKKSYSCNFIGIVKKVLFEIEPTDDFYEANAVGTIAGMALFKKKLAYGNYYDGCVILAKTIGVGRIKPNTILTSHDSDWKGKENYAKNFYEMIVKLCEAKLGIMIALNFNSLDFMNLDPFGAIDVWWLHDDGGLSILIPFMLSKSVYWKNNTEGKLGSVPLRLFILSDDPENDKDKAKKLLMKFRLNVMDVICVEIELNGTLIKKSPLRSISDLMTKNSQNSKFVICTMPPPECNLDNSDMFIEFLDVISENMPPMIMMRGNGKSVLTWKSE